MTKTIVIAVDTKERTLDTIALGRVLADAAGLPARLVSVFPHTPLADPDDAERVRARDDAKAALLALGRDAGLREPAAEVIAGNFAARELQHVSERPETALIVVGSTTRGAVGRLLIGGVGERLLSGSACPVAIAPRGFADAEPRLMRIGVGVDGSEEA